MNRNLQKLKEILYEMRSVLIAYSGGVDSAFLLKIAKDVLKDKLLAVTAESLTYPLQEIEQAKKIASHFGVRHLIIATDELSNPEFIKNPIERCYWCKKELFSKLTALAKENSLNYVLDGSNYDDIKDFRPGKKAAAELGIRSPLQEAGLGKEEIRNISKELGLSTWNKPQFACLASRFPYGTTITKDNLTMVNYAEEFVRSLGIKQVRVRHYNHTARIEILPNDISAICRQEMRNKIISKFKELGYNYITIDLEGYRPGSMNEILKKERNE